MIKPAIVVVGYNRPQSIKRLLESICEANYPFDDITLIVSNVAKRIDAYKRAER